MTFFYGFFFISDSTRLLLIIIIVIICFYFRLPPRENRRPVGVPTTSRARAPPRLERAMFNSAVVRRRYGETRTGDEKAQKTNPVRTRILRDDVLGDGFAFPIRRRRVSAAAAYRNIIYYALSCVRYA